MFDTFCQKFKINQQKKFIFIKIAVGEITGHYFDKKNPSQVLYTGELTQKVATSPSEQKLSLLMQNVKLMLNQDKNMCPLKIHDNVLLSQVSNERAHDSPCVFTVKPFNEIHAQSCNRNAGKGKVQA